MEFTRPVVNRDDFALTVLNSQTIALFGGKAGRDYHENEEELKSDGFVFDVKTKSIKAILRGESDVKFDSSCYSHRISSEEYLTIGRTESHET